MPHRRRQGVVKYSSTSRGTRKITARDKKAAVSVVSDNLTLLRFLLFDRQAAGQEPSSSSSLNYRVRILAIGCEVALFSRVDFWYLPQLRLKKIIGFLFSSLHRRSPKEEQLRAHISYSSEHEHKTHYHFSRKGAIK